METALDLKVATGIGDGDAVGFCGEDFFHFAAAEAFGFFGMRDAVNAGAAAAEGGLGQVDQVAIEEGLQERARLGRNFLAVAKMAGVVVGGALGWDAAGWLEADFDEPFVDIANFCIPEFCFFPQLRILRKQTAEVP